MSPVPEPQCPMTSTPVRSPAACSASQAGELAGLEARRLEVEATLGHHLVLVRQCLEQPVTQHPELQTVEELMGRLAVPRAALQIVKADAADRGRAPAH